MAHVKVEHDAAVDATPLRLLHATVRQHVTTDETLMRDLRASLMACGIDYGSTWGDFKRSLAMVEQVYGYSDSTPFASIELGVMQFGSGLIRAEVSNMGIEVKEKCRS